MANQIPTYMQEGASTSKPPFFDGTNYGYWKKRMQIFMCEKDVEEWKTIKKGYTFPKKGRYYY